MQQERKTWVGKALAAILSIFVGNWEKFAQTLWLKVPDPLQQKVNIVIRIVENVKKFVDSPTADFFTSIIPGDLDDDLKEWLSRMLPVILEKVRIILGDKLTAGQKVDLAANLTMGITGMDYEQAVVTNIGGYKAFKLAQAA